MPVARYVLAVHRLFGCHVRQNAFLARQLFQWIASTLDMSSQETGEVDRLATDFQDCLAARDFDDNAAFARVDHLTGDGALPDQLEKTELVGT